MALRDMNAPAKLAEPAPREAPPGFLELACVSKNGLEIIQQVFVNTSNIEAFRLKPETGQTVIELTSGNWYVFPAEAMPAIMEHLRNYRLRVDTTVPTAPPAAEKTTK